MNDGIFFKCQPNAMILQPSGVVIEPGIDSTVSFGEEGQGAKFVYHWDNINVFSRKPPHGFERSMHVANQPPPPRKKGACFAPPAKQILRNGMLFSLIIILWSCMISNILKLAFLEIFKLVDLYVLDSFTPSWAPVVQGRQRY